MRLEGASLTRELIEGRISHLGTFEQECARLCATADVSVRVRREDQPALTVVEANDWLTMDGAALLERVAGRVGYRDRQQPERARHAARLRILTDDAGRTIGRACLTVPFVGMGHAPGVVCAGGFAACGMHGIAGVLLGRPTTATRQEAIPFLRDHALAAFASDQVRDVTPWIENSRALIEVAKIAWHLGAQIGDLPVAWTSSGLLNAPDIQVWFAKRNSVVLANDTPFQQAAGIGAEIVLGDDIVVVSQGYSHVLIGQTGIEEEWLGAWHFRPELPRLEPLLHHDPLLAVVLDCLVRAWGLSSAADLEPQLRDTDVQVGTVHGAAATSRGYRFTRPLRACDGITA